MVGTASVAMGGRICLIQICPLFYLHSFFSEKKFVGGLSIISNRFTDAMLLVARTDCALCGFLILAHWYHPFLLVSAVICMRRLYITQGTAKGISLICHSL